MPQVSHLLPGSTSIYRADAFSGVLNSSREAALSAGIAACVADGVGGLLVQESMLPYNAALVPFNSAAKMLRNGQNPAWYDLRAYGAAGDSNAAGAGTDDTAAILAWIAAPPIASGGGGTMFAPRGSYKFSQTLAIDNKRVYILGEGPGSELNTNLSATNFIKAASLNGDGIQLQGHSMGMQGITLIGVAGNGGDGISQYSNYQFLRDVSVYGMGNDGIRVGQGNANTNCNFYERIVCRNNTRYGLNADDGAGGINGNVYTFFFLECSLNGSDGVFMDNGFGHTFVSTLVSSNGGAGLHFGANAKFHTVIGGDFNEGNGGAGDLVFDAGSLQNQVYGGANTRTRLVDNGTENLIFANTLIKAPYVAQKSFAPTEAVLVSGVDVRSGAYIPVTLTAARLVGVPLNPLDGQRITFQFLQNVTGGWAITFNAVFVGLTFTNTGNVANTRSSVSFVYNATTTKWHQDGAQSPWAV